MWFLCCLLIEFAVPLWLHLSLYKTFKTVCSLFFSQKKIMKGVQGKRYTRGDWEGTTPSRPHRLFLRFVKNKRLWDPKRKDSCKAFPLHYNENRVFMEGTPKGVTHLR